MNRSSLACADVQSALADHVDGLLEPTQHEALARHLATCAPCAREEAVLRTRLARLATPWPVAGPASDLAAGALERRRRERIGRVRRIALVASHAAALLVGLAIADRGASSSVVPPDPTPAAVAPSTPSPALAVGRDHEQERAEPFSRAPFPTRLRLR